MTLSREDLFTDLGATSPGLHLRLPLPTPAGPCQPLTLHIQTSLDKLEALEHPPGVPRQNSCCSPPCSTLFQILFIPQSQTPARLLSEAWSSLPVLWAFRTCVQNCSNHRIRICLPPRQNSASLNVGEMGPLCVPGARAGPGREQMHSRW